MDGGKLRISRYVTHLETQNGVGVVQVGCVPIPFTAGSRSG